MWDIMELDEQLDKWLNGEPLHNYEINKCCPDFSCCKPELIADKKTRHIFCDAYKRGDKDIINTMLMGFLANSLVSESKKVYIAGQEVPT